MFQPYHFLTMDTISVPVTILQVRRWQMTNDDNSSLSGTTINTAVCANPSPDTLGLATAEIRGDYDLFDLFADRSFPLKCVLLCESRTSGSKKTGIKLINYAVGVQFPQPQPQPPAKAA